MKAATHDKEIEDLETMILMSLDANHSLNSHTGSVLDRLGDRGRYIILDQGCLLDIGTMRPESAYTSDISDDSRLYAIHPKYLTAHPADIIGEKAEAMLFMNKTTLKWIGLRRLKNCPKGVSYFGRATHWYEYHFRIVAASGMGGYGKRVVPIDRHGNPLAAKIQGHSVCTPNIEGISLIATASMLEDAHRSGTMLAAIKDATEIKFPVPLDDYKDVFGQRDGPMNGNRRRAIIHWVARHLRRSHLGNEHIVKRHTRGVQEFTIDGLKITLTPNDHP